MQVDGIKFVSSGKCLSRNENGEICFVDGLIPGEKATVNIKYVKSKIKFAEVEALQTQSEDRVEPPCPYVSKGCGGCDWQHIKIDEQSKYKREIFIDALTRITKLDHAEDYVDQIEKLDGENYRVRVRTLLEDGKWGYRKNSSHDFVPIDKCLVLTDSCQEKVSNIANEYLEKNLIERTVTDDIGKFLGNKLVVSENSFLQSHKDAPNKLANVLIENIKDLGENLFCIDLYSGIGLFSIALAKSGHKVIAVEGNPTAVKDAKKNIKGLDVEVVLCDVKEIGLKDSETNVDVVVVDPSREGIGKDAIDSVLSFGAKRIVLISCDPASGARDIKLLIESGYELDRCIPIDMFGHTHHLEVISILNQKMV
ncbi:MAG: methyltransferase domain-containing protein [Acidimicrobiia bacterium]